MRGCVWVVAAIVASVSTAQASPIAVDFDGCHSVVNETAVVDLLRIELAAESPSVELLSSSSPADAVRVHVRCLPESMTASISVGTGLPRMLSLVDTTPETRPRTLALALSEQVRLAQLNVLPEPKPPPQTLSPVVLAPLCDAQCRKEIKQKRLSGDWALGLAITAGAGFAAGTPLVAVYNNNSNGAGARAAGDTLLGVGSAALVGAAISFAIWMVTPNHSDVVVPTPASPDRAASSAGTPP